MKSKALNKLAPRTLVLKAMETTKETVSKANGYALVATEDVVTETLDVVEQWQTVAQKALKAGLKLSATQQDLVFDTLTGVKGQFKLSRKRFKKLMA